MRVFLGRTLFRSFDENADGTVSQHEFRKGVRNLGIDMTDEEFNELMETLDEDNSNEIDCEAPSRRLVNFVSFFSGQLSSCPFWRPNAWHSGRDSGLERGLVVSRR